MPTEYSPAFINAAQEMRRRIGDEMRHRIGDFVSGQFVAFLAEHCDECKEVRMTCDLNFADEHGGTDPDYEIDGESEEKSVPSIARDYLGRPFPQPAEPCKACPANVCQEIDANEYLLQRSAMVALALAARKIVTAVESSHPVMAQDGLRMARAALNLYRVATGGLTGDPADHSRPADPVVTAETASAVGRAMRKTADKLWDKVYDGYSGSRVDIAI